jgi:hypothetical protein
MSIHPDYLNLSYALMLLECLFSMTLMNGDLPYAREIGLVEEEEAAGTTSAGYVEGHDVPPDVLTSVLHWFRQAQHNPVEGLADLRKMALEGGRYCYNEGCEVGLLKDCQVCPQCKTARYCSDACLTEHWTTGGHKETCGFAANAPPVSQ